MPDIETLLQQLAHAVSDPIILVVAWLLIIAAAFALFLARARGAVGSGRTQTAERELGQERRRIDAFLGCRRIALVGASSDASHFSRVVMRELLEHGVDVVPVHPSARLIEAREVAHHVSEIVPAPEAVLIMTPAAASAAVVENCARAGIQRVWLHRGAGAGAVSEAAVRAAHAHKLELVAGRCPLMFLGEHPAAVHRVHAAALRLVRRYPRAEPRSADRSGPNAGAHS